MQFTAEEEQPTVKMVLATKTRTLRQTIFGNFQLMVFWTSPSKYDLVPPGKKNVDCMTYNFCRDNHNPKSAILPDEKENY